MGCGQYCVKNDDKLIREKTELYDMISKPGNTTAPVPDAALKVERKFCNTPTAALAGRASSETPISSWIYDMTGHADQCVDRYPELANKDESSLKNILTPSIDEHQIPPDEFEGKGILDAVAARIVLKLLYLARVGRMHILWSVNTLAREVTRWNPACDRRLHRLVSYLHNTRD